MKLDDIVGEYPDTDWYAEGPTRGVENVLEGGGILVFPRLAFELGAHELRYLDPRWADGRAKNVSLRWPAGVLRGAAGDAADLEGLKHLIGRFADASEALVLRLFPHYRGHLDRGNTSLRPVGVSGRETSWRRDDARLHVDAFPSNPMQGTRLLRAFCNVNPFGETRRWRVGEPFEAHARRYLGSIGKPLPGSARLLQALGITKRRRTRYDHVMLRLHDLAKADADFQRDSPQFAIEFRPGTTWVCFSDQVLHAAMGGQHMLEQTFLIGAAHLLEPRRAPIATLERLVGHSLST